MWGIISVMLVVRISFGFYFIFLAVCFMGSWLILRFCWLISSHVLSDNCHQRTLFLFLL